MSDGEIKGKIGQAQAHEVLLNVHALLKLTKFYSSNNAVVQDQLAHFMAIAEPHFQREGEIEIGIHQMSIFVNQTRVKFDFSNYHILKALHAQFNAHGLGSITFREGLTAQEMSSFVVLLSKHEAKGIDSFEPLRKDFAGLPFPHISIEKTKEPVSMSGRTAARMYYIGINHLKGIFAEKRPIIHFNLTKRWVQSMIVHLSLEESYLVGLTTIKNFDDYTLNHSVNVCVLALALGRRLGLNRHELSELGAGALFHDLGKLDIPNEILDKPGALSADERAIMETHSHRGAERLVDLAIHHGIPSAAIQIALEHHEKHDLSGYPLFVKKGTIGLYSKIVKVVDYFDALTTKRNYRKKTFSSEEALKIMSEKSGIEFDPVILKAFSQMVGAYPIGSLVFLSTGEMGIVFEANEDPAFSFRPKVKLITDLDGNMIDGPVADMVETDPQTGKYARTIINTLDPEKYGIDVTQYFLAQAV